jgi:hypothetical protein
VRSAAAALLALLACACGNGDPAADASPPDAMEVAGLVELGTGTTDFEPLAAGQDLPIEAGPQGGHHFIVHARIHDLIPGDPGVPGALGNPRTTFEAFRVDDGRQVDMEISQYQLGYEDVGGGMYALASGRLLFLSEPEIDELYDQDVRVVVYVRDVTGTASRDERVIHAIAPP